jgi:hypothetical protein
VPEGPTRNGSSTPTRESASDSCLRSQKERRHIAFHPLPRHYPCSASALLRLKENHTLRSTNVVTIVHTLLFSTEDKACVVLPRARCASVSQHALARGSASPSPLHPHRRRGLSCPLSHPSTRLRLASGRPARCAPSRGGTVAGRGLPPGPGVRAFRSPDHHEQPSRLHATSARAALDPALKE